MPREIITIAVGQAGVQVSNAVWELFCMEHGIAPNGLPAYERDPYDYSHTTLFKDCPKGNLVPRTCIVDLEPTVIDEVRLGAYRNLYHPDYMVNGIEDAANNFARGQFTMGRQKLALTMDKIRRMALECENLQGFIMLHGVGGGTGSGFGCILMQHLQLEYSKNYRFCMTVLPGPQLSSIVVEPYNVALTTNTSIEDCDLNLCVDNEALYDICKNGLGYQRPTFNNVNRIIAQVVSSFTSSSRFECCLSSDLTQLQTNLVPFPRIHFPTASYAPVCSDANGQHEHLTTQAITRSVFERGNQLASCNPMDGKFMAINLQFKGNVSPKDVNMATSEMKANDAVKFVNWSPTGYKIGISHQPPVSAPSSYLMQGEKNLAMFCNNTCLTEIWSGLTKKFDCLFQKRAFVHWYVGEGMEEGELNDAKTTIEAITSDYNDLGEEDGEGEDDEKDDNNAKSTEKEDADEPNQDATADDNDDEEEDEVTEPQETEEVEVDEEYADDAYELENTPAGAGETGEDDFQKDDENMEAPPSATEEKNDEADPTRIGEREKTSSHEDDDEIEEIDLDDEIDQANEEPKTATTDKKSITDSKEPFDVTMDESEKKDNEKKDDENRKKKDADEEKGGLQTSNANAMDDAINSSRNNFPYHNSNNDSEDSEEIFYQLKNSHGGNNSMSDQHFLRNLRSESSHSKQSCSISINRHTAPSQNSFNFFNEPQVHQQSHQLSVNSHSASLHSLSDQQLNTCQSNSQFMSRQNSHVDINNDITGPAVDVDDDYEEEAHSANNIFQY